MTDKDQDKSKKRENPWGKAQDNRKPETKRPIYGSGQGGGDSDNLDEMLRKAQENFKQVMPDRFNSGSGVAILFVLGLIVLWLLSGFYIVNPGENAVIQRFGKFENAKSEPGLGYHLPYPFETVTVLNVEEIRNMTIGFSDFAGRSRDRRSTVPEESMMLTSDQNIVDINLVIQWTIKSAEDFLFNIDDQENTIKKVAESAIREVIGQTDMFQIITTGRQAVADRAREIIQANLDQYKSGVTINQVLIEKAEVHPDVQDAFQDVQSAKQDAEDIKNRAEAYREDIIPKARGEAIKMVQEAQAYKESVVARASGDASRFNAIYKAYLSGQDVTKDRIYIETMETVLGNAQKIILDTGENGTGAVPYLPLNSLGGTQ